MRKYLLASTIVLAMVPAAFAGSNELSTTSATSVAGVSSEQGTNAAAAVGGRGGTIVVGTISGNTTTVTTGATSRATKAGSVTRTTASQTNLGGTVSGGLSTGKGATGTTSGSQGSTGTGTASASGTLSLPVRTVSPPAPAWCYTASLKELRIYPVCDSTGRLQALENRHSHKL
jgi:hypothetical protein